MLFYKASLQFLLQLKIPKWHKSAPRSTELTDHTTRKASSRPESFTWGSPLKKKPKILFLGPFPHESISSLNTNVCHIPNITSEASCASKKQSTDWLSRLKAFPWLFPSLTGEKNFYLKTQKDLKAFHPPAARESKFPPNVMDSTSIPSPASCKADQPSINWT